MRGCRKTFRFVTCHIRRVTHIISDDFKSGVLLRSVKGTMVRQSLSVWLMAGSFLILTAQDASAESLRQAVQSALATHPTVEAAQAAALSAQEAYNENRSDYFPELSMSVGGGRVYGDNSTSRGLTVSRGAAYSWLWEGSTSLSQNIFNGFETVNRVSAASARESAAVLNVADARETLALRTTQAYLSVLRAQETLTAVREYQAKIDDYLKRVQDMVEQGGADESEAAQARNTALMLKDNEAELEGQLESAIASYREVVGNAPSGKLDKPVPPKQIVSAGADAALSMAKENHPALKSIQQEMEAALYDVKAEQGTLLPDLDGELSYLKRDQKEEIGGEAEDRRAMLRASWDVSLGGGDFARVRKAKADYAQNTSRLKEKEREIERDIRLSYAELGAAKKQYDIASEREKITTELLEAYKVQFEGARVRLLQLMQSENQVFGTKLDKMNADYRVLAAEFAVLASSGKLQEILTSGVELPVAASTVPAPDARISRADNQVPEPVAVEPAPPAERIISDAAMEKTLTRDLTGGAKDKKEIPAAAVPELAPAVPEEKSADIQTDLPGQPVFPMEKTADAPAAATSTPESDTMAVSPAPALRSVSRAEHAMTEAERILPKFVQE